MAMASWAASQAARFLSQLGDRWVHVRQTAARAREIAPVVPPSDRELLIAAAYLHDVGYAPALAVTGFHPLDGARWIRDHGPGGRLARLVAHHSCAIFEARLRGLGDILLSEFEPEATAVYDALVFCDMVTGPSGQTVTLESRLAEVARRYGPDHEVTLALESARPCLTRSYVQTLTRLNRMGITPRRGEADSPNSAGFAAGSTGGSHSGGGPQHK